jgi:predicted nuclease of predicted toxin-antitoxin system
MVRLYADENFPLVIVELLRTLGHDVLTVHEAGNGRLGIPDEDVLAFAISDNRAVLTRN